LTRFFDTSALAKRYVSEPGSAQVRATLRTHAVGARITYAELAASVARANRMGAISEAQRDAILARLAADFASDWRGGRVLVGRRDLMPGCSC
jgi:predicted nucleic acid-binding protein